MVLGVMSDTHGNTTLMLEMAESMEAQFGVQAIFHLGDDYKDAEWLEAAAHSVYCVPGLWCPEYGNRRIPKTRIENIDGITVACAHAKKDLRHAERAAAIILTGHTHEAALEHIGASLYVNPGHLTAPKNRGEWASYAIIDIGPDAVHANVRETSGKIRLECTIPREALAAT